MAYVKTNWETGDVVTSSKLNNMETGIYDATEASASAFAPDISNPQNGQTLVYNATQQKWVNGAGGGSYTPVVPVFTYVSADNYTCDKTYAEVLAAVMAGTCDKAYVTADDVSTVFPLVLFGNGMVIFAKTAVGSDNVGTEVFAYTSDGIQHGIETYPTQT